LAAQVLAGQIGGGMIGGNIGLFRADIGPAGEGLTLQLGVIDARGRKCCFGLQHRNAERRRIDREEQLTCFHDVIFLDADVDDPSGDFRRDTGDRRVDECVVGADGMSGGQPEEQADRDDQQRHTEHQRQAPPGAAGRADRDGGVRIDGSCVVHV